MNMCILVDYALLFTTLEPHRFRWIQ